MINPRAEAQNLRATSQEWAARACQVEWTPTDRRAYIRGVEGLRGFGASGLRG